MRRRGENYICARSKHDLNLNYDTKFKYDTKKIDLMSRGCEQKLHIANYATNSNLMSSSHCLRSELNHCAILSHSYKRKLSYSKLRTFAHTLQISRLNFQCIMTMLRPGNFIQLRHHGFPGKFSRNSRM